MSERVAWLFLKSQHRIKIRKSGAAEKVAYLDLPN